MPNNAWYAPLITLQAAGPALSNSTTQTSVLNGQAKATLPAEFLQYIGQKLRISAAGVISTAPSGPGTLAWTVMFGSIAVYAGGASGTLATSASGVPWNLDIELTVRAVGSGTSATVAGNGKLVSAALSATTPIQLLTVPGALTGFDSTVASVVDLQATWSVASASNTLTCHSYELTSCN
ncbi:MAG TPA: hypothetical protein VI653_16870 [Steroidobacteraceae bacterium]